MKIRIETKAHISEDEIIIRCSETSDAVRQVYESIVRMLHTAELVCYQGTTAYYLPVNTILFFETSQNGIDAHTVDDIYQVKNRLYELEELLPVNFIRISKSSIVNIDCIYSIDRTLTSSGCIQFYDTHKQVYVSRNYYKNLKFRLEERRNYHE